MRCGLVVLLALWAWAAVVTAAPALNLPIDGQFPPVARVGAPFVFTLLPGTFTSAQVVQYTTSALPTWLKFAPAPMTFYGTPAAADVGQFNVTVTASDSTGLTNSTFLAIVSDLASPTVHQGFGAQIMDPATRDFASVQITPGDSGITVNPYWSFSIGWSGDTFRKAATGKTNNHLYYQAHLRGGSSLPSWLQFSNTTFTFNGVAPANGSYPIVVTGTDFWGFTAAETSFVLSVGDGPAIELNSKNPWAPLNTVSRGQVNYKFDPKDVLINGTAADWSQAIVTPDLSNFKWLSFDNTSGSIIGNTPDNFVNGTPAPLSIPVTISSTPANDTLTFASFLQLNVVPYFFSAFALPNATTAAGSTFLFDLSPYLLNQTTDIRATVVPKEAASWLIYYPENHTLVGDPPVNISYSTIDITFNGTLNSVSATTALNVNITGIEGPTGTGEPAPVPIGSVRRGLSKKDKIIIGCVVGIVGGFIVLLILLLLCCRRRNKTKAETGQPLDPDNPSKTSKAAHYADSVRSEQEQARAASRAKAALAALAAATGLDRLFKKAPAEGDWMRGMITPRTPSTVLQTPGGKSIDSEATVTQSPIKVSKASPEKAQRLGAINGLFANDIEEDNEDEPQEKLGSEPSLATTNSFVGQPEILGVRGPARPAGEPSKVSTVDTVGGANVAGRSVGNINTPVNDGGNPAYAVDGVNKVSRAGAVNPIGSARPIGSGRRASFETFSSLGSRASWESERTFHWSGENEYLPPMAVGTGTGSPAVDESAPGPATNVPRPLPGFYPRYPRNVRPGERPYVPNDTLTSFGFSEFQSNRSLNSFADPGSAFGSSGSGGSSSQPRGNFGEAVASSSGSLFGGSTSDRFNPPVSALSRLASGSIPSGTSIASEASPAALATAERRQLQGNSATWVTPTTPSPARRFASSRRSVARVQRAERTPSIHVGEGSGSTWGTYNEAVRAPQYEDADIADEIVFGPVARSSTFGDRQ